MQKIIRPKTPFLSFMVISRFKSELGLFKFKDNNKLNIFKPKLLVKISPNDSRNISR